MKKLLKISLLFTIILTTLLCGFVFVSCKDKSAEPVSNTEYEIYPNPQSIIYLDKELKITDKVDMHLGGGIDKATENHVYDAFSKIDSLVYKNGVVGGRTKIYVGVYNSGDIADTLARSGKVNIPTGHFDKIDAYILAIVDEGIIVLGKDTDAAFYGITTLSLVFDQVEDKTVRQFTVYDYSNTKYRGFIEGYYGFPWSTDNRVELMRFGSQFKTNIYSYAPKDDPSHSGNWRG